MAKAEAAGGKAKGSAGERASRFWRNAHVVGVVALAGAAVLLPPFAPVAVPLAEAAALSAAGSEAARRHFAKRQKKKSK